MEEKQEASTQTPSRSQKTFFSRTVICLLFSALVCALWGSLYTVIKSGYTAFSIDTKSIPSILLFAGVRFFICGIILVAIVSVKDKQLRFPDKKNILPILLVALLTVIIHYSLTYVGLSMTEGSKTSVLKQVGYLVVSCFAFLFYREDRFSLGKLFGGILGFGSIIVMNLDDGGLAFTLGDILIIIASFCSAGGNIASKYAYKYASPVYIVAWSQLIGGAVLTIAGLAFGGRFHAFDFKAALILTYICAASIVAYSLWNILLRVNPLSLMSIYKFMEPLFGVIVAAVILHENIWEWKYLIALLMLLGGIMAGNIRFKKKSDMLK